LSPKSWCVCVCVYVCALYCVSRTLEPDKHFGEGSRKIYIL
jgi:hypothetical protein